MNISEFSVETKSLSNVKISFNSVTSRIIEKNSYANESHVEHELLTENNKTSETSRKHPRHQKKLNVFSLVAVRRALACNTTFLRHPNKRKQNIKKRKNTFPGKKRVIKKLELVVLLAHVSLRCAAFSFLSHHFNVRLCKQS